jgi:organic radical activating enzyme
VPNESVSAEELLARPPTPEAGVLRVSEIFESLQGEGPSVGSPCLFLRLALCNLSCDWCDTAYSWDLRRFARQEVVHDFPLADIVSRIVRSRRRRVVITGGEPLLQQPALGDLLRDLPPSLYLEVETNGTLLPTPELAARIDQWNVSPKLSNSGQALERRLVPAALERLRGTGRAWLKLVVGSDADLAEASQLLDALHWPRDRVYMMPLADNAQELGIRSRWLADACVRMDLRFSPRLHVDLWRGERGR